MSGATPPVTFVPSEHGQNMFSKVNPLNAELNPIYHLLALLGAHHILHISRIRVNVTYVLPSFDNRQKNCYVLCVVCCCVYAA